MPPPPPPPPPPPLPFNLVPLFLSFVHCDYWYGDIRRRRTEPPVLEEVPRIEELIIIAACCCRCFNLNPLRLVINSSHRLTRAPLCIASVGPDVVGGGGPVVALLGK